MRKTRCRERGFLKPARVFIATVTVVVGKIEKIKLRNFKSFKNAVIPVSQGYTAIVGPNGSGKSNIVDALVFGLGTSSMKSLRAGRLTDLISHDARDNTAEITVDFRKENDLLCECS